MNQTASAIMQKTEELLQAESFKTLQQATPKELHYALSKAVMAQIHSRWTKSEENHAAGKRAYYFSAEFLMGRAVFNNLYCLGVLDEVRKALEEKGVDLTMLEEIEDDALGNGGLGRLAACFLDSAATQNIPLDGYGIRYQYGLFKQYFENGFQKEMPDDWQRFGDPWSIRREEESVLIHFARQTVKAVPYDMPIIGCRTENVGTLRLWQSEAVHDFDLALFNEQKYDKAVKERNDAENISKVLYPNDDTNAGKRLRLKQQYFFSSASLQDILRKFKKQYGNDFSKLPEVAAIQLNDTHPTVSIPELLRLLVNGEGVAFQEAFEIACKTFAYTNHTIMPEALEKWNVSLFRSVIPQVYKMVVLLDRHLVEDLTQKGVSQEELAQYRIIDGDLIHMARMAIYASSATNGVAQIHTEILKNDALKEWYALYPERFQNKTNGITQRRWLGLCNPQLSAMITELIGDGWLTDLEELKKLEAYQDDENILKRLNQIKLENKRTLCDYVKREEGFALDPNFIFDIQVKRLHEYKRQLLNAFSIMDLYFTMKEGGLKDFTPTVFLFGAKSAPGYYRAKGIIKYINCIAELVNNDPDVKDRLAVKFVSNYRVSYAEKLIPAADVSEQISTAGTEASGTGNMKFMLNGAVTLGTYDGANVEIVEQAGEENNYIFGARVEEIAQIAPSYDPKTVYEQDPRIKRVVDTLIDGTFDDEGTGMFRELYTSLLEGASWHKADNYYLLYDLKDYLDKKLQVNRDYKDSLAFAKKRLLNIANAGKFSSDRTVKQYAREIWGLL